MSKHAYKSHKHQNPSNRLDTVTSVGSEASYQSKPQETYDYNERVFIPEQDIQKRAYEIYQLKGGSDIDNWLEAEKILEEERRSAS
jgi:hypothetical protein